MDSYAPVQKASVDQIEGGENVREVADDGLTASVQEHGIRVPLEVTRGKAKSFRVVDGARRLAAARRLNLAFVPVRVIDKELSDGERLVDQLTLNLQRKGLQPIESAHGIKDLMRATGWNASEVATKLGFSVATVSRLLALLSLPEPIQAKVQSGAIAAKTGYELAKAADSQQQLELAEQAANGRLTADEASAVVRAAKNGASPNGKAKVSRFKVSLEQGAVTISGQELTAEAVIALLTELLKRARKQHSRGLSGDAFVRALREASSSASKGA